MVEVLRDRNETIDWCLVGEPSSESLLGDTIKIGRRGSLSGRLTVHGVQGHIAYPQFADNPIHAVAPALAELASRTWDHGNEHFQPTTFQVSNISAGTGAPNVIPGELKARFNLRFSTEQTVEALKATVERILERHRVKYSLEWFISGYPFLTVPGTLSEAATRAVQEELQITPKLSTGGGTSDGRFIAPMGAQVIELGVVNATIHKANECVRVADIERLRGVYRRTLELLLEPAATSRRLSDRLLGPLLHAVAAAFQAGRLRTHVVAALVRRCRRAQARVKAALAHRPLMAVELVLRLLIGALPVLRVRDQIGTARRRGGCRRAVGHLRLQAGRRRDGHVLAGVRIPGVIGVVGVIVRNAAPIVGRVVIRQRREIEPNPETPTPAPAAPAAAPAPVPAAAPATVAAPCQPP